MSREDRDRARAAAELERVLMGKDYTRQKLTQNLVQLHARMSGWVTNEWEDIKARDSRERLEVYHPRGGRAALVAMAYPSGAVMFNGPNEYEGYFRGEDTEGIMIFMEKVLDYVGRQDYWE